MAKNPNPLPREVLQQLDAVRTATGLSPSAFGRTYFKDASFLRRMQEGAAPRQATRRRIAHLLEIAAACKSPPAPPRVMSTEVYPTLMSAVAESGLSEGQFAARYLGHGWAINRLRKKPRLLTAEATARIQQACSAVLGRSINFANSPE